MKVIFLDFDGVLNSQGSFLFESCRRNTWKEQGVKGPVNNTLCNVCTVNFQYALQHYKDVKVVISSTWRLLFTLDELKVILDKYHIDSSRVIGMTKEDPSDNHSRGDEIQWWLDEHPEVTHYVIIDDNDWDITGKHGKDRFVQTTWEGGMTFAHTQELIEKLSNFNKKKIDEKAAVK